MILKGVPRSCGTAIGGTLAALSLTPMHSLRHRLVRSRQYASQDVLGFWGDFEISKNGERVGTILARLAVRLETCGLHW